MMTLLLAGILIGIGATLAMDLWALLLNRVFGLPLPNWGMVGRWFWHAGRGKLFHDDIALAAPHARERAIGWGAHYAVGIVNGIVFALIMGAGWLAAPTFLPAWIFGLLTVAAGWFLLAPGMGAGWAASRAPKPWVARGLNLAAHTAFALGLWGAGLALA